VNIYVETNFVLEVVFQQEKCQQCEEIIRLCESGRAQLFIPAYSLAEPHEKLYRQKQSRRALQRDLESEIQQLTRSASYSSLTPSLQVISRALIQSFDDEREHFRQFRSRVLKAGHVIPLTSQIIDLAAQSEDTYDFSPQDALVFASVIDHLRQSRPPAACFLNKNSKDFDNPDIVRELRDLNCKMIARFDHGWRFIQSASSTRANDDK
jgi:predicted nucleic acid-binding protein